MLRLFTRVMLAGALVTGCVERSSVAPPPLAGVADSAGDTRGPAKLHLRDGRLVVLESWRVGGGKIAGQGREYGVMREPLRSGPIEVPIDEVALVETSHKEMNVALIPLMVVTGASLALTITCATNPKACFGSCPTFYVPGEGKDEWKIQAEGFSASIAKIFEADDLDDLPDAREEGGFVTLAMRNEALETHMIRRLGLEVVRGPAGSTVLRGFGKGYLAVGALAAPDACSGPDLDGKAACAALAEKDANEVLLESDGKDLATKSTLTLHYPAPGKREVALVLTARNSLMSTYVLYQMMAFHGREYGELIASLERGDPRTIAAMLEFDKVLGGVDVAYRQKGGAWQKAATLGYIGPIARATRAARFEVDAPSEPVEVQLSFARSHWRFDAARLAPVLAQNLAHVEVEPEVAVAKGRDPAAVTASVRGQGPYVVTMPGDEIVFRFPVPKRDEARESVGYFLASRGYYHEWMRDAWEREEDLPRARAYLDDPARALRELAPAYRAVEPSMEQVFRASRFWGVP